MKDKKSIRISREYDALSIFAKIIEVIDTMFSDFQDCLAVIITVTREFVGISSKQRGYYFGGMIPIVMQYHGIESKEEAHKMLKAHFLLDYEELLQNMIEAKEDTDKTLLLSRFISIHDDLTITTSEKGEFEEYLKKIRFYYSHKGVFIPLPNEEERWDGWEMMK